MSKNLYRFFWDCGRMGSVKGLFFAEKEMVDSVIGQEIFFGEILGKHSEVYGTLDKEDLEEIELADDVSKALINALGENVSGYNPLEYAKYTCPKCKETVDAEEFDINNNICWECSEE